MCFHSASEYTMPKLAAKAEMLWLGRLLWNKDPLLQGSYFRSRFGCLFATLFLFGCHGPVSPQDKASAPGKEPPDGFSAVQRDSLEPGEGPNPASSKDPRPVKAAEAILNAFDKYRVMALGEAHGLQEEHDFIQPIFPR